jgi:hypothetical protein
MIISIGIGVYINKKKEIDYRKDKRRRRRSTIIKYSLFPIRG